MIISRGKSRGFYCFSPPVMIFTFAVEITYLAYILYRYKMDNLTKLVGSLLLMLATFQLAEYFVCGGLSLNASSWSQVGFVAITMLPALGIHIVKTIAGKPIDAVTKIAYVSAVAWSGIFLFYQNAFYGHECGGNYIIFQIQPGFGGMYFAWYYLWLFIGAWLSYVYSKDQKPKVKKSLGLFTFGYLTLLIPTTTVNLINPETMDGIPSIMCGFAIVLASIITFGVMPKVGQQKIIEKFNRA